MEKGATGDAPAQAFAHCAELVRTEDADRATAVLFASSDRRDALNALYAFDLEVAAIRDRVRQPLAGEIRLQWWRDAIGSGAGGQGSPIAEALLHTIAAHALPRDAFERLLDARIFDLYDDPMPSREAFETYAGETSSAIVILAAMILDRERAPSMATLAGHAGVALAVARALRSEPRTLARQQVYVPSDILSAIGLERDTYLKGGAGQAGVRAAMAAFAGEHLVSVDRNWAGVPRTLRPAFLETRVLARRLAAGGASPSATADLTRGFAYWRAMRAADTAR